MLHTPHVPTRRTRAFAATLGALVALAPALRADFTPVPLPNPQIPGYTFPEAENTILTWVANSASSTPATSDAANAQIALHGWGIWTSLTAETDQTYNGQKLRVFETWLTPQDITNASANAASPKLLQLKRASRPALTTFRQFHHVGSSQLKNAPQPTPGTDAILGFVKYDPTAADHIGRQGLLKEATLNQLLANGANQIPVFPATALVLKPVFQPISKSELVGGRYYKLPVWPGPPAVPQQWDSSKWPGAVWIDIQGGGSGQGQIDTAPKADGSSRTDATTYPVSALINFQIDAAQAAQLNQAAGNNDAAAGDYAILLAMHVSGRETTRWTWQTFWWTPTPNVGTAPSSDLVVKARPAQLTGAPANYAMAIAYTTELPSQPNTGGINAGTALYAYNPWLEAGFGPSDLPNSLVGYDENGAVTGNNYGVQTNCLSCHGAANYNPANLPGAPGYSGARYIDLNDPRFSGTLKVDFLWSIPGNAQ